MDDSLIDPPRGTQELLGRVLAALDAELVELYLTILRDDPALLARVSRFTPDALEDHFHRELFPMARRHPKLQAAQSEMELLEQRPIGADWGKVSARLASIVGEGLLPKFEATFELTRQRLHAGERMTLKLDEPWQRALWYRMLVPRSFQERYTLDDWNREVAPNAEFAVWGLASEGDPSACGILMLAGNLAGGPPFPIDEFFSVEHLCGCESGIQRSLDTAWNLWDSLGAVA